MEIKIADCPLGAKCEEVKTENGKPVLYRCPWYVQLRGTNSNTGDEIDDWGCSIAYMPMLMINTANESRKGVAATESFRNEMVKDGEKTRQSLSMIGHSPHGHHPMMMLANAHPAAWVPVADPSANIKTPLLGPGSFKEKT